MDVDWLKAKAFAFDLCKGCATPCSYKENDVAIDEKHSNPSQLSPQRPQKANPGKSFFPTAWTMDTEFREAKSRTNPVLTRRSRCGTTSPLTPV